MKHLMLDDDVKRFHLMLDVYNCCDKFENYQLVWCWTANMCIEHLMTNDAITVLYLDHDLKGIFQSPDSTNCGMEIVRWIEQNAERVRNIKMVSVHSMNYKMGRKMAKRLRAVGLNAFANPINADNYFQRITDELEKVAG